jgi:hypothetical protein
VTDETILLDPTVEAASEIRPRLQRPVSLEGLKFGLLDINKHRGDVFLKRIDELLQARGFQTEHFIKPRFSITAPVELQQKIQSRVQVVIEGLAD